MRWRVFVLVSVALNVALAVALLLSLRQRRPTPSSSPIGLASGGQESQVKTNIVIRRQFFSWQEVESDDYPTYVANLRDIGCPEQTIRDIIIADVNTLFARRRATEVITPEQQWWRTDVDTNVLAAASAKLRELEGERRALLVSLLGPSWEAGDMINLPRPTRASLVLDGQVLGALSAELKQAIQEISARSQERIQAYAETTRKDGKPPDPIELAKLRQQTRDELARVLTPPQLEEFLLRFSQNASALRSELVQIQFFNATAEEFRALFRARDAFDQQLALLPDATDTVTAQRRTALEQQREAAIKLALGEKRYAEYQRLHDPAYREAFAEAQQADTPEAVAALYAIKQAVAEEQQRIRKDDTLTEEQKNIELKRIELEQLKANALALGQPLPPEESPPPPPPATSRNHVIGPGENVFALSVLYSVPIDAIFRANPNVDFRKLKPGDSLRIPMPRTAQ